MDGLKLISKEREEEILAVLKKSNIRYISGVSNFNKIPKEKSAEVMAIINGILTELEGALPDNKIKSDTAIFDSYSYSKAPERYIAWTIIPRVTDVVRIFGHEGMNSQRADNVSLYCEYSPKKDATKPFNPKYALGLLKGDCKQATKDFKSAEQAEEVVSENSTNPEAAL